MVESTIYEGTHSLNNPEGSASRRDQPSVKIGYVPLHRRVKVDDFVSTRGNYFHPVNPVKLPLGECPRLKPGTFILVDQNSGPRLLSSPQPKRDFGSEMRRLRSASACRAPRPPIWANCWGNSKGPSGMNTNFLCNPKFRRHFTPKQIPLISAVCFSQQQQTPMDQACKTCIAVHAVSEHARKQDACERSHLCQSARVSTHANGMSAEMVKHSQWSNYSI